MLNADLVVLSACETALGQITAGDHVVGCTRGLHRAGAHSIVSTLWQADDRAARGLMVDFYSRLETASKSEAQPTREGSTATPITGRRFCRPATVEPQARCVVLQDLRTAA